MLGTYGAAALGGAGMAAAGAGRDTGDGNFGNEQSWLGKQFYDKDKSFLRNMAGHAANIASVPLMFTGPLGWAGIAGMQAGLIGSDMVGAGQSAQGAAKAQGTIAGTSSLPPQHGTGGYNGWGGNPQQQAGGFNNAGGRRF